VQHLQAHDECVFVRGAAVVVATRPVTIVPRDVAPRDVAAGIAAVAAVVETDGLSGAALLCTCVAANALIDASDVSVAAVAIARSSTAERMSGERDGMSATTPRRPRRHMKRC
jgi:hypothetical protein